MNMANTQHDDDPFHPGERALQEHAGVRARMVDVGRRMIRDHMTAQHEAFFAQLPFVVVGAADAQSRPWATLLAGTPGFARALDPRHLRIDARPASGDPLALALVPGQRIGLLGIELHTRRRNRLNGRIEKVSDQGLELVVEQTVGNCPQYIQQRELAAIAEHPAEALESGAARVEQVHRLDAWAGSMVAAADTLFVATHAQGDATDPRTGADVSHRGGRPGFTRIEDERTLLVPDFAGNGMFMTLGNIHVDPRAGLLFVDFERGDLLSMTGRATLCLDAQPASGFAGAERAWRFRMDEAWALRGALPLRWRFRQWSPATLRTGVWPDARGQARVQDPARDARAEDGGSRG